MSRNWPTSTENHCFDHPSVAWWLCSGYTREYPREPHAARNQSHWTIFYRRRRYCGYIFII